MFRHEGDYWTVAYRGALTRLRDAKGLRYIAYLLQNPGCLCDAVDLVAVAGGSAPCSSDAAGHGRGGDNLASRRCLDIRERVADRTALAAYRGRLSEIEQEEAEAERWNDYDRAERLRAEKEALLGELAAARRMRDVTSHSERARVAVTTRISDAIKRIRAMHQSLGHHLRTSIRTGRFCVYIPDPDVKESWIF